MKEQHSAVSSDYRISQKRGAKPNDQNLKKQAKIYRKILARRLDDVKLARQGARQDTRQLLEI